MYTCKRCEGQAKELIKGICRSCYWKWYKQQPGRKEKLKNLSSKYNWSKAGLAITREEYDFLFQKQNGLCKICNKPFKHRLSVDHDHNTGEIRGLLCRMCNGALGILGDSPEKLLKVYSYLISTKCIPPLSVPGAPGTR